MNENTPHDVVDLPAASTVDLWWLMLADDADAPPGELDAAELLQPWEQQRAVKFATPLLRRRYIQSHAGLRRVLAPYLQKPPGKIAIEHESFGKPRLAAELSPQLQFNLSHSGSRALVALRVDSPLGVDLERIRTDLDFAGVGRQVFAAGELALCRDASGAFRPADWFQLWTLKEAGLKAIGRGMLMQPQRLVIAPDRRTIAVDTSVDPDLPQKLVAAPIDCQGDWSAAVASPTPFAAVRQFWYPDSTAQ